MEPLPDIPLLTIAPAAMLIAMDGPQRQEKLINFTPDTLPGEDN